MTNLDKTDLKLLEILQENGKLTTKEMAQQVNLSPTPVYERVRRLEREGVLKKYIALVEAEKVGKAPFVILEATHIKSLQFTSLEKLKQYSFKEL